MSEEAVATEMAQLEIRKGKNGEVAIGGLRFVACRREVGDIDGGITLYVFADGAAEVGDAPELLRFDLFREKPHYHAPGENQQECKIETADGQARAWGIDALTTRAPELAAEAGYDSIGARLDRAALAEAGPALDALFDGLGEPDEVSYFEVPRSVLDGLQDGA